MVATPGADSGQTSRTGQRPHDRLTNRGARRRRPSGRAGSGRRPAPRPASIRIRRGCHDGPFGADLGLRLGRTAAACVAAAASRSPADGVAAIFSSRDPGIITGAVPPPEQSAQAPRAASVHLGRRDVQQGEADAWGQALRAACTLAREVPSKTQTETERS